MAGNTMRAGKRNRTFMKTIRARFLPGCFIWLAIITAQAQTAQTNLAVTVRHAPNLNGGTLQGSLQQLNGAMFSFIRRRS